MRGIFLFEKGGQNDLLQIPRNVLLCFVWELHISEASTRLDRHFKAKSKLLHVSRPSLILLTPFFNH